MQAQKKKKIKGPTSLSHSTRENTYPHRILQVSEYQQRRLRRFSIDPKFAELTADDVLRIFTQNIISIVHSTTTY